MMSQPAGGSSSGWSRRSVSDTPKCRRSSTTTPGDRPSNRLNHSPRTSAAGIASGSQLPRCTPPMPTFTTPVADAGYFFKPIRRCATHSLVSASDERFSSVGNGSDSSMSLNEVRTSKSSKRKPDGNRPGSLCSGDQSSRHSPTRSAPCSRPTATPRPSSVNPAKTATCSSRRTSSSDRSKRAT